MASKAITAKQEESSAPVVPALFGLETVQLRSLADTTLFVGRKSIEFITGSANVTPELAAILRESGHID